MSWALAHPGFSWLKKNWLVLGGVFLLLRFGYRVLELALSYPNLLQIDDLLLPLGSIGLLLLEGLVVLSLFLIANRLLGRRKINVDRTSSIVKSRWLGIALALVFFGIYFILANVFNRVDFNNNNVFFAADTHQWRLRLSSEEGHLMEMRAIHPLAFLILRPFTLALSLLMGGQPFHAVVFLVALVGSASIYLCWSFIRQALNNDGYAFLMASISGVSAAHLIFSSLTETYIFSAFFLALFFVLLLKKARFHWLVLNGLAVFGITISNPVQIAIALLLTGSTLRRVLTFGLLILVVGAGLSLVNGIIYPDSALFFTGEDSVGEIQHYLDAALEDGIAWRAKLVGTDMLAFSIVAPQPFLQTYNKDGRGEFPKFNFMQGDRLSQFVGTGRLAAWMWIGILGGSALLFIRSLITDGLAFVNRYALAAFGCLAFNFLFHLIYGFEPFLYAADWTFALVLLVALALRPVLEKTWVQGVLLVFFALLTLNNLYFINFIMNGIAPFVPAAGL